MAEGVNCALLQTSHAFHSEMVDQLIEPLIEELKRVNLQPPRIPFVTNVTGDWITAAEATDPLHWIAQARQCVRFGRGLEKLLQEPRRVLLEVGPREVLSTIACQEAAASGKQVTTISTLGDGRVCDLSASKSLVTALGSLWLLGVRINWDNYHADERRQRVPLPTYPFERQRYWVEPADAGPTKRRRSLRVLRGKTFRTGSITLPGDWPFRYGDRKINIAKIKTGWSSASAAWRPR